MKKAIGYILLFLVGVAIGAGIMYYGRDAGELITGGSVNYIGNLSMTATTTSDDPLGIQLLGVDFNRQYAIIINDSDTAISLSFPTSTTAVVEAVNTNTTLVGVKLNATGNAGDRFVIDQSNLYTGLVYASSTAASKQIYIVEN